MPRFRVVPYRQTAIEIAERLAAARAGLDPLAPWEEEVIVPSRGMAEAIAAALLERMPDGIAGLRLHSLEDLARSILAARGETPRVASEAERRLAMRIAVRNFDEPLMQSRGIAAMLERSYRDVRDSGITIRARRGLRNVRRTELVLRAWSEYERLIPNLDPAELLLRAAADVSPAKPQLLAGFYDMTGVQRRLTEALIKADLVRGIWVPSDLPFARPFIESFGGAAGSSPSNANLTLQQYDTRIDELRGTCAQIAALLAKGERDIGIVARSLEPYDVRLLNRFAAEYGFRTTLREEIPLTAHRIGRGALTLLRLRERNFPRSEVLGLLRDGLRVQTRIHVDDADAATRKARIAGGTSEELRRMRNRSRVIEDYVNLVAELETMPFDPSRFRVETTRDVEAVEKLEEIAALIKRMNAAQPDLIDAIEQATLHVERTTNDEQPVVWAGELLRFRGRSFKHLFAIRMQDDVFPQRRTEDPLLPDSDRRQLGLREIGDGREEEQLLFSLVTQAAEHVTFSHATGDGFGKVLRRSRFVRSLDAQPQHAGNHRQPPTANRQLQLLVQSGTRSSFDGYIGPLDPANLRALSPTQLEDFGECPQKFLLKHILRVEDVDHPERELQIHHRDKGTLDHRILEEFYRGFDGTLTETALERLDALIDKHFDDHAAIAPPFNPTVRGIERGATKRLLREFLAADVADLETNGLTPKYFEYRFGAKHEHPDHAEPFVVQAGEVPVRVEGTIDRIDIGGERYRIVDYKSGKALRHLNLGDKIDRGVRLQLALYAMAVAEFFRVDPEHVSGTIKPLVPGDTKPLKFAFALHEKRAGMLETLELFIRAILAGRFPAFPNEDDDFNSCKYCPVNHSCRTRHDLDERYAVQRFRDPRTLLSKGAE
ncbi:MAG TPA: PD-(D/E)XK nuclease family protein [Thermoanaerobaculia bacterium]|nr:PD-(D/E)XK nuclease family protein [Thermoanaerobaculia bacterium]